ncbi:MAG: hypothetical protein M1838_001434 [Thelocarpon superellum]|nr:MAG: hypothetical protein M1838_001434 [Thelocarpon superellum]
MAPRSGLLSGSTTSSTNITTSTNTSPPSRSTRRSKTPQTSLTVFKDDDTMTSPPQRTRPSVSGGASRSQPVGIPHRPAAPWRATSAPSGKAHLDRRPLCDKNRSDHVAPAVAALLAITAIPLPKASSGTQRRRELRHRTSVTSSDDGALSIGSLGKSPMDVLMSPPEDQDEDEADAPSESARSVSCDSVPALDTDDESIASSTSPLTPVLAGRRPSIERRGKCASPLQVEDCELSHPLLAIDEDELGAAMTHLPSPALADQTTPPAGQGLSFTSNLTASFRALRSAARIFSNFATPVVRPDDFLTRSIPYTDEWRPLPLDDTPTPALRRYLNATSNSPFESLPSQSGILSTRDGRCRASIQLQTYRLPSNSDDAAVERTLPTILVSRYATYNALPSPTTPRSRPPPGHSPPGTVSVSETGGSSGRSGSGNGSSNGVIVDSGSPFSPRHREVRENSDFLRVIVLEMNMRRRGKLSESALGKARTEEAKKRRRIPFLFAG